ncbi:hypothetical protein FNYG_13656 [Fusarium nygamai]|uniref:Uncharacterized protein n=1 Tax=Gibberella nygamai TaxID=42673 RepID=A0A2K0UV58_GIBNY|nr:hypothetical protein FNYG_13656 [Fusarium nygamai]
MQSSIYKPPSRDRRGLQTRLDLGLVRFPELRQLSIEVNVLNFAIIDPAHVDEIAQLVLLQPVSERGIEREKAWVEEHYAELKAFCNKRNKIPHFAAFEAWLGKRLEDGKGGGDAGETAGPLNKEAPAARPKTI